MLSLFQRPCLTVCLQKELCVSHVLHFYSCFRSPVCQCFCSRTNVSPVLHFYLCLFQEVFAGVSAVETMCHLFSTFTPVSLFQELSAVETVCHLFSTFIPVSGAVCQCVCSRNNVSPVLHFYYFFRSPVCCSMQ